MSNGRHFLCQTVESDQIFDAIDELSEMTLWRIKNILLMKLVSIFPFGECLLMRMSITMSSARKARVFQGQSPTKFYASNTWGKCGGENFHAGLIDHRFSYFPNVPYVPKRALSTQMSLIYQKVPYAPKRALCTETCLIYPNVPYVPKRPLCTYKIS